MSGIAGFWHWATPDTDAVLFNDDGTVDVPVNMLTVDTFPSRSEVLDFCYRAESLAKWLDKFPCEPNDREQVETWFFWLFEGENGHFVRAVATRAGVPRELYWLWMNGEYLKDVELHGFVKVAGTQFHERGGSQAFSPKWKTSVAKRVNKELENQIKIFTRPRQERRMTERDQQGEVESPRVPAEEELLEEYDETESDEECASG